MGDGTPGGTDGRDRRDHTRSRDRQRAEGAIDAAEWVGPWADIALGLDKAADHYYYPGFHEPGTNLTLGLNKTFWDGLAPSERALIEAAATAEMNRSLAQFNAENVKAFKALRSDKRIKMLRFSDDLIKRSASSAKKFWPTRRPRTR